MNMEANLMAPKFTTYKDVECDQIESGIPRMHKYDTWALIA